MSGKRKDKNNPDITSGLFLFWQVYKPNSVPILSEQNEGTKSRTLSESEGLSLVVPLFGMLNFVTKASFGQNGQGHLSGHSVTAMSQASLSDVHRSTDLHRVGFTTLVCCHTRDAGYPATFHLSPDKIGLVLSLWHFPYIANVYELVPPVGGLEHESLATRWALPITHFLYIQGCSDFPLSILCPNHRFGQNCSNLATYQNNNILAQNNYLVKL